MVSEEEEEDKQKQHAIYYYSTAECKNEIVHGILQDGEIINAHRPSCWQFAHQHQTVKTSKNNSRLANGRGGS